MSELAEIVQQISGADSCELQEVIQSLWSGYGVIQRVGLSGANSRSAIVKHIDISQARENRRGWSGSQSHERKVRSYEVEKTFYEKFAFQLEETQIPCRVPQLIGAIEKPDSSGWVILLEDLDAAGFDARKRSVDREDVFVCLHWLANFHATYMSQCLDGLWPVGTYWHLETRPEELDAMPNGPLKNLASEIDRRLSAANFQTLVHGDAKLANFCFQSRSDDGLDLRRVAAVDFQYIGGGCGMKDVAYFISSCLSEEQAEKDQDDLLDFYFDKLRSALVQVGSQHSASDIEAEWRELYPFAWADFCRFLAGWSPGHWKLNRYSDRITRDVVAILEG